MTDNPLHPGFQPNVIAVVGNPRRDSRTLRLASGVADGLATQVGSAPALTIDLVDLELDRAGYDQALTELVLGAQVVIAASPTVMGSYAGLLRCFSTAFPKLRFSARPPSP